MYQNIIQDAYIYLIYSSSTYSLQLFYLNFTKVEDGTIQSPIAGMIHWTTDMLKRRELEELSKGGFGNVTISLQHMNMNRTEQGIFEHFQTIFVVSNK